MLNSLSKKLPILIFGLAALSTVGCNQNNDDVNQQADQGGGTSENSEPQSTEGTASAGTSSDGHSPAVKTPHQGKSFPKVPTQTPIENAPEAEAAPRTVFTSAFQANLLVGSWREVKEHVNYLVPGDENTKITYRHFVRFTDTDFIPWTEVTCANGTTDQVQFYGDGVTYSSATENLKYKFDGEFITFSNTNGADWVSQKQVCGKDFSLTFGTAKLSPSWDRSILKMKKVKEDQTQSAEFSFERYSN